MGTVAFTKKNIIIDDSYELIIIGGGTAGAFAGISASRSGVKTLIIEKINCLGGSAAAAMVTPVMSSGIPFNMAHSSISRELNSRLMKMNKSDEMHYFDPLMLSLVVEEMVLESGCDVLYHSSLIDVEKENREIEHVIIHNIDGLKAYKAKYYIDATGDAVLSDLCGVKYESGDKDGKNQPLTLRFEMANINYEEFFSFMKELGCKSPRKYFAHNTSGMKEIIEQAVKDKIITKQDAVYFQGFGISGKETSMSFNCPELSTKIDVLDAKFITDKQIEGRRAILRTSNFLCKYVKGFSKAYVTHTAQMVGVRESRRIKALYTLTARDILSYKKFEDAVVNSNYPVDIHGLDDYTAGVDYDKEVIENERYWQIPFRVMVPNEIDNLLTVGRCSGFDFIAQSAARVQHSVRAMGESAGIAIAICKKGKNKIKDLDYKKIKAQMIKNGDKI